MKAKVLSLEGQLKISEDKCSQLQDQVNKVKGNKMKLIFKKIVNWQNLPHQRERERACSVELWSISHGMFSTLSSSTLMHND